MQARKSKVGNNAHTTLLKCSKNARKFKSSVDDVTPHSCPTIAHMLLLFCLSEAVLTFNLINIAPRSTVSSDQQTSQPASRQQSKKQTKNNKEKKNSSSYGNAQTTTTKGNITFEAHKIKTFNKHLHYSPVVLLLWCLAV